VALETGQPAPDFALRDHHGTPVRLGELREDRIVVIVFFPFAFTGICTGELTAIQADIDSYQNEDVQVLAISCDAMPTLRVFADREGFTFPLLSDFWPHGAVSRAYGVFDDRAGLALRGTFIVDRLGIVRWSVVNPPGQEREAAAYRAALATL
jgi:peroxiredoxin